MEPPPPGRRPAQRGPRVNSAVALLPPRSVRRALYRPWGQPGRTQPAESKLLRWRKLPPAVSGQLVKASRQRGLWAVGGPVQRRWPQTAGSLPGEQDTPPWRGEPEQASPKRMVRPARSSHPRLRWALWGTGNEMWLPGAWAPRACPVTVGAGGPRAGRAPLGPRGTFRKPKGNGAVFAEAPRRSGFSSPLASENGGGEGPEAGQGPARAGRRGCC